MTKSRTGVGFDGEQVCRSHGGPEQSPHPEPIDGNQRFCGRGREQQRRRLHIFAGHGQQGECLVGTYSTRDCVAAGRT